MNRKDKFITNKMLIATTNILVLFISGFKRILYGQDPNAYTGGDEQEEEDEWPPFKKVGQFDPYSDDPRLAVKKVSFCGTTGRLVIGGTAGQVIICDLVGEAKEDADVPVIKSDLVTEKEGFTWKGHQALLARPGPFKMPQGFQPRAFVQITPPA